jgi:hypothetical protein
MKRYLILGVVLLFVLIQIFRQGTPNVKEYVYDYHAKNQQKLIELAEYLDHTSYADTGYWISYNKSRIPQFMYQDSSGGYGGYFHPEPFPEKIEAILNELGVNDIRRFMDKPYYACSFYNFNINDKQTTIFLYAKYKTGDQFPFGSRDTLIIDQQSPKENEQFYIINPRIAYRVMQQ